MATEPEQLPEWADQDTTIDGEPNVIEPPQSKKDFGWGEEIPGVQYQNWWQRIVYRWIEFFDAVRTIVSASAPPVADAGVFWGILSEPGGSSETESIHTDNVNDMLVSDGILYTASSDGTVKAHDLSDFSELFSERPIGSEAGGFMETIAIDGNTLYVGGFDDDHEVVSLDISDPQNVTENWVISAGSTVGINDIDYNDTLIFVANADKDPNFDLTAYKLSDQTVDWSRADFSQQVNRVVHEDTWLYVGSDEDVYRLDDTDGTTDWTTEIGSTPRDLLIDDQDVFVSKFNGEVTSLSKADGSTNWTNTDHDDDVKALVLTNGLVISGDDQGRLIGMDKSDGSVAFDAQLTTEEITALTRDGNILYAGTEQGNVDVSITGRALYISDGSEWLLVKSFDE